MKKTGFIIALLLSAALLLTFFLLPAAAETAPAPSNSTADPAATGSDAPETPVQPELPPPAENSVFLTHSTPLRAGNEVTFTFSCSGEGVRALQGVLTYDTGLLTYQSASTLHKSWLFTISEEEGKLTYIGLSTEAEGASGVNQLFSLTFILNENAVTGNSIPFHIEDATALKGKTELTFTGGPCTFLVDRPLSEERTLTSLDVSEGTLAPAFDPAVTEYRLQVPFECQELEISAVPCAYASVEIGNTSLKVGNNTVTVTVIAESGLRQVYTLTVTRQTDPNYIPSSDSLLTNIYLSDGMLFPAFSPSVTQYRVYLVNSGSITLTPEAAQFGSAQPVELEAKEGAVCTITSIAEDGSETVYTFTALLVQTPDELAQIQRQNNQQTSQKVYFIALLAAVAVTLFFVGFAVNSLFRRKKTSSAASSEKVDEEALPADSSALPSSDTDSPEGESSIPPKDDASESK